MSAKVGIPIEIPAGKKTHQIFKRIPWENIPLDWKGNKFHGKKISKLRCYSFCEEVILFEILQVRNQYDSLYQITIFPTGLFFLSALME